MALALAGATAHTLDLHWSGPPSPHQKFVNIYRVLYVEDEHEHTHAPHPNAVLEIQSIFKVAKIDSINAVMLTNLKPNTRYQVWLQAYLRNGKVLESNVLEVETNDRKDGSRGGGGDRHGHGGE
jgi:hypothetical protein